MPDLVRVGDLVPGDLVRIDGVNATVMHADDLTRGNRAVEWSEGDHRADIETGARGEHRATLPGGLVLTRWQLGVPTSPHYASVVAILHTRLGAHGVIPEDDALRDAAAAVVDYFDRVTP